MKPRNPTRALKLAAKLAAYEWYCRFHDIPDPDFSCPVIDPQVVEKHGQALAWAEGNWVSFAGQSNPEDRQFLMAAASPSLPIKSRCSGCRSMA